MCGTSKVYYTSNLTGPKAHNIIYINNVFITCSCISLDLILNLHKKYEKHVCLIILSNP